MSNKQELKTLWARVSRDPSFRARFLKDPLAAAACLGIVLNASQVAAAHDARQRISAATPVAAVPLGQAPIVGFPGLVTTPRLLPK